MASLMIARLLAILAAAGIEQVVTYTTETMSTWSYQNQAYWHGIIDQATECSSIEHPEQSPVNIDTNKLLEFGDLDIASFKNSMNLGPLGWSLDDTLNTTLEAKDGSWIIDVTALNSNTNDTVSSSWYGYEYPLEMIAFHAPSENTIDGKHFDMEAQFVHRWRGKYSTYEYYLVHSVLMEVRSGNNVLGDNPYLAQFWPKFPKYTNNKVAAAIPNPYREFYPADRSYYQYNGSLSAPPCSGHAAWIVFEKPVAIGANQLKLFRESINMTQSSRLEYAATNPNGVSCSQPCADLDYAWDRNLGTNARLPQAMGDRWVKHVSMKLDGMPATIAVPTGGYDLRWSLALVGVVILACCIVGFAMHSSGAFNRKKRSRKIEYPSDQTNPLHAGHGEKPAPESFSPVPQQQAPHGHYGHHGQHQGSQWPQQFPQWSQPWGDQWQWAAWAQQWEQWQQWQNYNSYMPAMPQWDPRQMPFQAPQTAPLNTGQLSQMQHGRLPDLNSFEPVQLSGRGPGTGVIPSSPSSNAPTPPGTPPFPQPMQQAAQPPPTMAAYGGGPPATQAACAAAMQSWVAPATQAVGYMGTQSFSPPEAPKTQSYQPPPTQAVPQTQSFQAAPTQMAAPTQSSPVQFNAQLTQSLQPPTQAAMASYQLGTSFNH